MDGMAISRIVAMGIAPALAGCSSSPPHSLPPERGPGPIAE